MGIICLLVILVVIAVGWAIKEGVKSAFEPKECPKCGEPMYVYCDKTSGDIYYVCTKCDHVIDWSYETDQVQDEQGRD